jgi:predicted  nucleic acid-binding Zn-ribbon protein
VFQLTCEACGAAFEASRESAKCCSAKCRQRKRRQNGSPAAPKKAGKVVTLAPAPPVDNAPADDDESGMAATCRRELVKAKRLDTPLGQAALFAAQRLEHSMHDTASSVASLLREYRAALAAAVEGAVVEEDPIEAMRRKVFLAITGGGA